MSDYNDGALQDPCLRLDYGFGEQWASVELGDGTGYVRLADYEKLESENAKLRDTTYAWRTADRLSCENAKLRELENIRMSQARHCEDLDKENAKLRELCADMMWTIRHAHGYFKDDTHELLMTYMRGRDGKPTHVGYSLTLDEEMYEQRMRELGIEVTDA